MKNYDYLIVGQGIAGSFFAFELIKNNKSFLIIDEDFQKASNLSAGIFNPVVLKRFVPIWNAHNQVNQLINKIQEIEIFLKVKLLYQENVLRIFHDEEEFKTWKKKAQTIELSSFLDEELKQDDTVNSPFGLGKVKLSGRIDVPNMIEKFKSYFKNNELILNEKFEYESLTILENKIEYKNFSFDKVVFCEGFQVKNNPFFNHIPILTDKGEQLKVKLSENIGDFLYKKKHFLFHQNEFSYLGGTYNPKDLEPNTTDSARLELINDLNEMVNSDYEIMEQNWGFRPVSKDRRPILGRHLNYNNLFILNGLGTRGTLIGATYAVKLYEFIELNIPLETEVNVQRF